MTSEAAHEENQRLLPTASFLVGVDGSRESIYPIIPLLIWGCEI